MICAVLALGTAGHASAQQYPAKSTRIVVGFAPGGGTDIVARIIGAKLTEANLAFADLSHALTDPGVVVPEEPLRKVARH